MCNNESRGVVFISLDLGLTCYPTRTLFVDLRPAARLECGGWKDTGRFSYRRLGEGAYVSDHLRKRYFDELREHLL